MLWYIFLDYNLIYFPSLIAFIHIWFIHYMLKLLKSIFIFFAEWSLFATESSNFFIRCFLCLHFNCYSFSCFPIRKPPSLSPLPRPLLTKLPIPTSWTWHWTVGHRAFQVSWYAFRHRWTIKDSSCVAHMIVGHNRNWCWGQFCFFPFWVETCIEAHMSLKIFFWFYGGSCSGLRRRDAWQNPARKG